MLLVHWEYTIISACIGKILDVIFVLDGSSSVQDNQFERLQNFVIDIIQELDIGENKTRVGALLFNEQPLIQFHLNEYFSTDELIDAVENIDQGDVPGTQTGKEIRTLRSNLVSTWNSVFFSQDSSFRKNTYWYYNFTASM